MPLYRHAAPSAQLYEYECHVYREKEVGQAVSPAATEQSK